MSRLRIEHSTVYTYQRPVEFGRHRLVLRPREGHDLQVESMVLRITPAYRLIWSRDIYSNSIAIVDFIEPAARLEVNSVVQVLRTFKFPPEEPFDPIRVPTPVSYETMESQVVSAYQSISYPDDLDDVRSWLREIAPALAATDAEQLLTNMCTAIYQQIKYQRRTVRGVQSPAQTLRLGTGSCRDMATLMMDAARSLGLAARFASGYLDCPAAEAGRAAMHAWVEVYLPVLGWRGFDPTLGEPASLKHIAVGVSHHPRGVMPISGMFNGASGDYVEMIANVKVDVLENVATR